jgi:formylglycine-generating enzyme required for sulfatase activity
MRNVSGFVEATLPAKVDGMKRILGRRFLMGSDRFYSDEAPVRPAATGDFWIDETPVTNLQFGDFVASTGYTTFAEIPPDPLDYPGILPSMIFAGSTVFTGTDGPADLAGPPVWWDFKAGANWRQPLGEGSNIRGLESHPVVHISYCDAEAYAKWAGKMLPSEAEWELAAGGGSDGTVYAWGDEFRPNGISMAKTFEGIFPYLNEAPQGLERTAPVRSYPPNGYGLYDMIGNVWEWTTDNYTPTPVKANCCTGERFRAPTAEESLDPHSPARILRRVTKGGSHLCAPNHCQRYRPAARWGQPIDTSTSHIGFRCIIRC